MQWLRLTLVGIAVAFVFCRVVPDAIRLIYPLGQFSYATDDDGVVIKAPPVVKDGAGVEVGDRVRIDRIRPFDRKPGLERVPFTEGNPDRHLPLERAGRERIVELKAVPESMTSRAVTLLRIVLYVIAIFFGALVVILKPRIMTVGFFVFCLGGSQPTSFTDMLFDVPWREIAPWIGDTIAGAAPFGLLLFAVSFASQSHRLRVIGAIVIGACALAFGTLHAYDAWRVIYAAEPSAVLANIYATAERVVNVLTGAAFVVAFARARGVERQRTGWILAAFAIAALGRAISDQYFPRYLNFTENGVLLSLEIVPVIVVWIAMVKHHFFDIDFVVSRALVYMSITVAVVALVGSSEELLTYIFYQNTDLGYGLIIACSLAIGACFGQVRTFLEGFIDRFVFHERREQRRSLERVATNVLDAEDIDTVWRVLMHDIPSILDLSFSGIMLRTAAGGYELAHHWQWPPECVEALAPDHPLCQDIDRSRGVFTRDTVRSTMIKSLFPNDRLTYAAPLYFDRVVTAVVLYGHSITGLDIDPEERLVLARVMANASIALNAIELSRYRTALGAQPILEA